MFKLRDHLIKLLLFFTMFYVLVNGLSLTGMNNGFAQSSQENVLSAIKNLRLGVHDAKTRIVMDVKGPITYRYFLLANPYRLVLDMLEVEFELNPAPFCLLDEVDAPLDDTNVSRFCEIVREMSSNVQFVVITHNKTTMELTKQLIGVTMSEPGVSRLVSVDLDEAIELSEPTKLS